eukprot:jgi/Hompol1/621/HPOL_005367-RA
MRRSNNDIDERMMLKSELAAAGAAGTATPGQSDRPARRRGPATLKKGQAEAIKQSASAAAAAIGVAPTDAEFGVQSAQPSTSAAAPA